MHCSLDLKHHIEMFAFLQHASAFRILRMLLPNLDHQTGDISLKKVSSLETIPFSLYTYVLNK